MHRDKGQWESFKAIKVSLAHDPHSTRGTSTNTLDIHYMCFGSVLSGCKVPRKQTAADRWPQPRAQAKRNVGGKGKEEKQKTESTVSQGNCVPGEEKTELLPAE